MLTMAVEGNSEGFRHQKSRWKSVEIALVAILMIAPTIAGCEGDKAGTASADRSDTIASQQKEKAANSVSDVVAWFRTMREVDEMAHEAARHSDFERALEIWRNSAGDSNQFSMASLCLFHMSESTPVMYRDYDEGFKICSSLAIDDFTMAQYALGRMYWAGFGVEKNHTTALYWFNAAAEGGDAESQYFTGLAYLSGNGLPKDLVLGYKWLNLAAGSGFEKAVEARDAAASLLTRSELSEAQKLTRSYAPRPVQRRDFAKDCSKWVAQGQKSY
jgi:TPR repeat protein